MNTMNQRETEALSNVLAYLRDDERKDLEASDQPGGHIGFELEVLDRYLKASKAPSKAPSGAGPDVKGVEFLANVGLATSRLEDAHAFLKTIWLVAQDIQEAQKIPY